MEVTGVSTPAYGQLGIGVIVKGATSVPKKDMIGHSDTFVRADVFVGDEKKPRASVRTSVVAQARAAARLRKEGATTTSVDSADVSWDETLRLGELEEVDPRKVRVVFTVRNQETLVAGFIGEAVITLAELISHTSHTLLLQLKNGDPVLLWRTPPRPCELHLALEPDSLPAGSPPPADPSPPYQVPPPADPAGVANKRFPRHVLMMSRGTRGDVQPCVALARGLAHELGYLVTLVTELHWKDFVVGKCADVGRGAVRFLPSGGDTELQTSGWVEQKAMSTKTEVMQMIMLAASEANFFASAPVVAHQIERAATEQPLDLLVSGFTMTGVGLLMSERFRVPVVNYVLQPTCIPSSDATWQARLHASAHHGAPSPLPSHPVVRRHVAGTPRTDGHR